MEQRRTGLVVKIDGLDGSGKTTLARNIAAILRERGLKVGESAEFRSEEDKPIRFGGVSVSITKLLKEIALSRDYGLDECERQLIWMLNSRRHNRLILPKLQELHDIVIVDRSHLSNMAYGCHAVPYLSPIFEEMVGQLENADLIIWLDTPVDVCWQRLKGKELDVVEEKGEVFFHEIRAAFVSISKIHPKCKRVDGSGSMDLILANSLDLICQLPLP